MVNKSQLAQRISARGASPAQAAHAVDAVLGEIASALCAGEKVTIVGFGTFEPVARPARTGRNPRTGDPVAVPAATVPRFHAGATLRSAVDGGAWTLGAVGSLAEKPAVLVVPPASVPPAQAATKPKPAEPKVKAKAKAPKAKPDTKAHKHKGKDPKGKKSGKKK